MPIDPATGPRPGPAPGRPSRAKSRLPSVAAGLVRDGELVWSGAVGTLSGRADGEPADTDTQYRIGSITKTFVGGRGPAAARRGPARARRPDRRGSCPRPATPTSARVTIAQLLSHTSGPAGRDRRARGGSGLQGGSWADLLASRPALRFRPGARFHYSNVGYAVLGELVGRLRGAPWDEAVRRTCSSRWVCRAPPRARVAPAAPGWARPPVRRPAARRARARRRGDGAGRPALVDGRGPRAVGGLPGRRHRRTCSAPDTLEEMCLPIAVNDMPGQAWTGRARARLAGLERRRRPLRRPRRFDARASSPGCGSTGPPGTAASSSPTPPRAWPLGHDLLDLLAAARAASRQPWHADADQATAARARRRLVLGHRRLRPAARRRRPPRARRAGQATGARGSGPPRRAGSASTATTRASR